MGLKQLTPVEKMLPLPISTTPPSNKINIDRKIYNEALLQIIKIIHIVKIEELNHLRHSTEYGEKK